MKDMRNGGSQQNDADGRNEVSVTSVPQFDLLAGRVEIRGAKVKEAESEARNKRLLLQGKDGKNAKAS